MKRETKPCPSRTSPRRLFPAVLLCVAVMSTAAAGVEADSARRVPAEWEPQEVIWR